MNWQEIIGLVGGLLGNFSLVPQVYRLFHFKSAYEISLPFLWIWLSSICCWLLYGIFLGLLSIMIWNSVTLVLCSLMFYAKFKWGVQKKPAD